MVSASHPSEHELIVSFLRPRVALVDNNDDSLRESIIVHDADVYSAHPADLTAEHAPAVTSDGDQEAWYFFTAPRAKDGCGRKVRTVDTGEGCWHSETGAKPVVGAGGHRQSFSFVTKEGVRRVRSGWLMVELGLDDDDGLTLCKVYFSQRAGKNNERALSAGCKRKATDAASNPATPGRRRRVHIEADNDDDETIALGEEKPTAAVEGDRPVTFSSLLWGKEEDDLLQSFSWQQPYNEPATGAMTALLNMSDEQFDREHPPPAPAAPALEYGGSPVIRHDVCMWMTIDEMYNHPDAKEIRSTAHRLLEEMRSPPAGTKLQ